jgi:Rab GDP dissociation inhibitor
MVYHHRHRALTNLDIYIAEVSAAHNVCAKNHYLAIVSTIVETDNPHIEIKPGLDLLGPILDK